MGGGAFLRFGIDFDSFGFRFRRVGLDLGVCGFRVGLHSIGGFRLSGLICGQRCGRGIGGLGRVRFGIGVSGHICIGSIRFDICLGSVGFGCRGGVNFGLGCGIRFGRCGIGGRVGVNFGVRLGIRCGGVGGFGVGVGLGGAAQRRHLLIAQFDFGVVIGKGLGKGAAVLSGI